MVQKTMNFTDIITISRESSFQPEFVFTDWESDAVDSILAPHEDYHLDLDPICRQILRSYRFDYQDSVEIHVNDAFTIQKRLLSYKQSVYDRSKHGPLSNLYIDLGYRNGAVTVNGNETPHHMFMEDLCKGIFPIVINRKSNNNLDIFEWFKHFQTIHPLNDLNGRVGGLILNIMSYHLYRKYVVNRHYLERKIAEL